MTPTESAHLPDTHGWPAALAELASLAHADLSRGDVRLTSRSEALLALYRHLREEFGADVREFVRLDPATFHPAHACRVYLDLPGAAPVELAYAPRPAAGLSRVPRWERVPVRDAGTGEEFAARVGSSGHHDLGLALLDALERGHGRREHPGF